MGNYSLDTEIKHFLSKYFAFERVEYPNPNYLVLEGKMDIVDDDNAYWGSFEVQIILNKNEYPHTVPVVIEKSNVIDRTDDLHISKEGACCLDIPHVLDKMKRRGIRFTSFYQDVIYPFFANYHYHCDKKKYAKGEYKHGFSGVIQFYEEEHQLTNIEYIVSLLKVTIGFPKPERNSQCPICGKPKFKRCCGKKVLELIPYGQERLKKDLDLFTYLLSEKKEA
ncbi:hypothetical protein [Maribacter sp. 2308TA10-17]|uniref:hypothetical protein n=1 Tax=Maribacter sp. 2308TA10-17 TaxID=3386276 RepID=UPI0039BCCADB